MYAFDITLMVLSQPSSPASIKMLGLFGYFSSMGLNCKVSTCPLDFYRAGSLRRRHVVVIDGTDSVVNDIHTMTSHLSADRFSSIVLLLDESIYGAERSDLPLEVHQCFSIHISRERLAEIIVTAAHDKLSPAPSTRALALDQAELMTAS